MPRQRGSAKRTHGVVASSPVTGLLPFATMTCDVSALTTPPASMSSAAVSPARTCRSLGKALASQVSAAVCGSSSRASLASYDRVSSSWRTSQLSFLAGSTACSVTLPKRGMMRSGSIFELPTLALPTDASGSSSSRGTWGTPRAHIGAGDSAKRAARGMIEGQVALADRSACGDLSPSWVEMLMGFPEGWTRTDGQSAQTKRSPKASRRASRRSGGSDGSG